MFRGQQTRSLNIGCLSIPNYQETCNSTRCVLHVNQNIKEHNLNVNFPAKYNHIIDTSFVPSLFELCKRKFYTIMSDAAKKLTTTPKSIYYDFYEAAYNENNNNIKSLQESLNNFNIYNNYDDDNNETKLLNSNNDSSKEFENILLTTKRKGSCVPKDMIEEYFYYLPRFIKNDLCNGPLSRCENVRCKKPIFDFVYFEFCIEKLILYDASEDIILNAAFCSKSCAEAWKPGKNIVHWKFL